MYQPEVERYKSTVMQRMQQAATQSYEFHTSGKVHIAKVEQFADKMNNKYHVGLNKNQKYYRKKKGKANASLFLYPKKNSDTFFWWLLVTSGEGRIHQEESLHSIFDCHNRLCWDDTYRLMPVQKEAFKVIISWKMTRQYYQYWNKTIRQMVRKKRPNEEIMQVLWSLARMPGFSEIRREVKYLYRLFYIEWARKRKKSEAPFKTPAINYLRATKLNTYPLALLVERINEDKRPFPRKN